MSEKQRLDALNRARVERHRVKLRTPEIIEEDETMEILKRQGYAVSESGLVEVCRGGRPAPMAHGGTPRWAHTHVAVVRLHVGESSQRAALIAAVVAAVDEPGALVGTGKDGAVLVFRIAGDRYAFEARDGYSPPAACHEFVLNEKSGLFATDASPLDVAAFVWKDDRSPLNTPVMLLPPIHVEIAQAAFDAVGVYLRENGGRFGPLVLPESQMEKMLREGRARIAAGPVDESPEAVDAALVAANPDLSQGDGHMGLAVHQARTRIAERKATERAAKKAEREKTKLKELQALMGNPT
jgi:hypothetical protein